MGRNRRRWLRVPAAALLLPGLAGRTEAQPVLPPPPPSVGQPLPPPPPDRIEPVPNKIILVFPPRNLEPGALEPPPVLEEEYLTLDKLLLLATRLNPELAAAEAQVQAARGKLVQAGLYPNPTIGWEADDLFNNRDAAGKQGPFIAQEIVTAGKLRLARSAAAHGVAAADWQAITRRFEIITRVRSAFYESLAAEREVLTLQKNLDDAKEKTTFTKKLAEAGGLQIKVYRPDILRWEQETNQLQLQLRAAEQRRLASRKRLAAAIGLPSLPEVPIAGAFEEPLPNLEWPPLIRLVLTRSSELQHAQALVVQAQGELDHARAEVVPNIRVQAQPFYSFPERDTQLMLQAGVALPIFNRNQGNILTAQSRVSQTQFEVQQAELRLIDRGADAFQRYETARLQIELITKEMLPKAEELAQKVRLGVDTNIYDTTALLEAQRGLYQVRLTQVNAWREYWRAASELLGLLQVDDPAVSPP